MLEQGSKAHAGGGEHDRRKIIVRGAVAAGLIAMLLASLLMFEQQKAPETDSLISVESKPDIGVALSSGSVLPEEVQAAIKDAPDIAQSELASMSAPAAETVITASPAPVVPEGSKDPSVKPILGTPAPVARVDPRTGKQSHNDRLLIEAPRSLPAPAVLAKPQLIVPAAAVAATGFVVQLGVFNNIANAEELQVKLKQAGIPSQLEARVQIGPFSSKDEATKAQEKLRALGLGAGILVSPKKP